jgi:hypothetical protein
MVRRVHNYADGGKIVKDHLAAGAPLGATPVNTDSSGRPRVGEADPATRRKMLNQRLNERQPAPSRPAPAPAATSTGGGVSPNAARLLRDRGKQIDKAVDKASR